MMNIRILARLLLTTSFLMISSMVFSKNLELEEKIKAAFERGELSGLHSVLVLRKGEIFAELHFEGPDEKWGVPYGKRQHDATTLHDLRSVTKSVVSLLYGIAHAEGIVPDIDECLVCQFPEYSDLAIDPERQKITIKHALTMRMGTEWNEDIPYSNSKNSEIAMELAKDRYRYVLDRPLVEEAGTRWVYNGGATAIVGQLITKGSGMSLDEYARKKLFEPLGIEQFEWVGGFNSGPSAASGLRLNASNSNFGILRRCHGLFSPVIPVKHGIFGKYQEKQIVPARWLEDSFKPHSNLSDGLRYGYFWWLAPNGTPPVWVAGFGHGGQRLTLNKQAGVVVVVFAGNYNRPGDWKLPVKLTVDFIVPALTK